MSENFFNIRQSEDPDRIIEEEQMLSRVFRVLLGVTILFLILVGFYVVLIRAPKSFVVPTTVTVEQGETLRSVSQKLRDTHVVRSVPIFEHMVVIFGSDKKIAAGDYLFKSPAPVYIVAYRMTHGQYGAEQIKVTIPEGYSRSDIAQLLHEKFPQIDIPTFLAMTETDEGYLFPDTYFFFPSVSIEDVVSTLKSGFNKKIQPIKDDISRSHASLKDIVTMASIIEREASGDEDRNIISGILWKRIELGMPLQADATLYYVTGKESSKLTHDDLVLDSKYNTYKYKGLPPGPIASPGFLSIKAALFPTSSPYLYYLHASDGKVYYAETYAGHLVNKNKYLK